MRISLIIYETYPPLMHILYKYCIGTLILLSLTIHPLQAQQPDNPGNTCDVGESVTKIESEDIGAGSSSFMQDGITISDFERNDDDEIIGGNWSRMKGTIDRIQVKIGGGADATADATFSSATNGAFSNSASGGSFNDPDPDLKGGAISNIRFCESDAVCDVPTLAADDVDKQDGTLSNTISDDDGVEEFTFTTLDGFEVQTIAPDANYDATDSDGDGKLDTWTWTGSSGSQPTSVDFTLGATESTATYFLEVTDACTDPGPNTTTFDPAYEFGPVAAQAQLVGNAPNPFSGRTTVEFALPERTRVTVSVYDMMGRKVATLVDGVRSGGSHTVSWNGQADGGQDLASGVYLMRMQADDRSETQRVTIVR